MIVAAVKESFPGERRVAIVPTSVAALSKLGTTVRIEAGAGLPAGFSDADYRDCGAEIESSRQAVFESANVLCQVRTLGANPAAGAADLPAIRDHHTLIGHAEPLTDAAPLQKLAETGVQSFAMELMPRITRAQSMDVLSSQATVSGYAAVLLAARTLPKMFPMMMTAAGTLAPARVFVVGAGVAGLQSIATARRLGAVVTAYDIRPAVKDQVESLGAKFLEIEIGGGGSEDKGGYAKAMDEAFYRKQREAMTRAVADSDVVITTAAVPGKRSPVLVTAEMVQGMAEGSVIIDLAAERGGNCELTKANELACEHGVQILGPTNLPADAPYHASQMYSRNIQAFLTHLIDEGQLVVDGDDEITQQTLLTQGGAIVQPRVREILGLGEGPGGSASNSKEDHG